jgi:hypothetical protein
MKQSNVVYFLMSKPDYLNIDNNQLRHTNRRFILPNNYQSYPLNEVTIKVNFPISMILMYPIFKIMGLIVQVKVMPWRKVIIESQGVHLKTINYVKDFKQITGKS